MYQAAWFHQAVAIHIIGMRELIGSCETQTSRTPMFLQVLDEQLAVMKNLMGSSKMQLLCLLQALYNQLEQMQKLSLSEMQSQQFDVFNKLKLFLPSLSMKQVLQLMLMTHEQMDEFLLDINLEEVKWNDRMPVERLLYLLDGQLDQTLYELIAKPTLKCLRIQVARCYDFSQSVHIYLSQLDEKQEHSDLALAMRQCLVDLMLHKLDFAIRQGDEHEPHKKKKLLPKHDMIQKLDDLTKLQRAVLDGIDMNDQQRELLNGLKLKLERTPLSELDDTAFTLLFGEVAESDYWRSVVDDC